MDKDKKKTLTISSDFKKKLDTSSISSGGKKSFLIEKKKPSRSNKQPFRSNTSDINTIQNNKKKKIV